ncbi:MAG: Trm112 family protein [Candidatus Nanoarchaeia archaeon]|nr:Trm112 family protein [Candidatus Nanoarchaeia archaeon]MDD5053783.1 Trm112 family protein [Candidatus Nanoarchaeia archaeon]MDD5499377.1 Trm112 family protein [Candidatus Nanoarchaeia archaeon]
MPARKFNAELLKILACPKCKEELTLEKNALKCKKCKKEYKIKQGIPILTLGNQ